MSVFNSCKNIEVDSNSELKQINRQEKMMSLDFEKIQDNAAHKIYLGRDEVTQSVDYFHKKKHIFIYNKDLSKGYFLKVDPNKMNEVSSRLQTFKFKEPRIVAADSDEEEKIN